MSISVVIPIYNEHDSIRPLHAGLNQVLSQLGRPYEVIFVDDGSRDDSVNELRSLASEFPHVKVLELRHNFGQSAAMSAGIQHATGEVIITMDGDLQNDPGDIPVFLERIEEGNDLVHGWRRERKDRLISRRIPSIIANRLISWVTGFPVHDLGCTMKAIRRGVAQEIHLYGEMHRFIPILGHWRGARCVEVVAHHHPRRFGKSKYGISRTLRVLLDLVTIKFLIRYLGSPMRLFGSAGLACGLVGACAAAGTIGMKLFHGVDMTGNPLLLLTAFSMMAAVQLIGMGMLGELGARIYYESQATFPYAVRNKMNFDLPLAAPPGAQNIQTLRKAA